jgi:predicted kinase
VELVILSGLQASGKSTFRRDRFPDHVVVSKDLMRNTRRKQERQLRLVDEALAAGRSVIVDNTNPGPGERAPLIELGRQHGARVVGYHFEPDLGASLARNAARPPAERVPPVGLFAVLRRLRRPSLDEGFDELWWVRAAGGAFEVSPLPAATSEGS